MSPEEPGPESTKRQGSGQEVPVGSGKSRLTAITQPGADSSDKPGAPGEILYGDGPVRTNVGRDVVTVRVVNTADRAITVGSHYHFAEVNPGLDFDREAAWGRHLDIISGGLARFDPGAPQEVALVPFAGRRIAAGFRGACRGPLDERHSHG